MKDNFSFLSTISESRLIPNKKSLSDYDSEELAELSYLHILTLRILLTQDSDGIQEFAIKYCRKTATHGNFRTWYTDGTDLYVMLYGLISDEARNADHHNRITMPIEPTMLYRFFQAAGNKSLHEDLIKRVFVKLDTWFRIKDSSMRAIRRLVMDWDTITHTQKKLALTRLLQFMRSRASHGELLPWLNRVGVLRGLELHNVSNPETGELKEDSLLKTLALENASAGATSAASVATVVGGLGSGFDADYSRSVYPPPKKDKPKVIRRVTESETSPAEKVEDKRPPAKAGGFVPQSYL